MDVVFDCLLHREGTAGMNRKECGCDRGRSWDVLRSRQLLILVFVAKLKRAGERNGGGFRFLLFLFLFNKTLPTLSNI